MNSFFLGIIGLTTGIVSAMFGVGGGSIVVPALIFLRRYRMKEAVGISLLAVAPGALVGFLSHSLLASRIELRIVIPLIIGSLISTSYGARFSQKVRESITTKLFGVFLLFVGLQMAGLITTLPAQGIPVTGYEYLFLITLGLFTGFSSAFFGIGGGALLVPGLTIFMGLSIHQAVTTSLAVILPTAVLGIIHHNRLNPIKKEAMLFLTPAVMIGAVIGTFIAYLLTPVTLKLAFGIFLMLVSVKLFFHTSLSQKS